MHSQVTKALYMISVFTQIVCAIMKRQPVKFDKEVECGNYIDCCERVTGHILVLCARSLPVFFHGLAEMGDALFCRLKHDR